MNATTQTPTNSSTPAAVAGQGANIDRLASGAHKGIDAASRAARPAIDRAAAGAHQAVEGADEIAHQAGEALHRAGDKGAELVASGSTYMRDHPLFSLGLIVTAGYALTRLLAPRR